MPRSLPRGSLLSRASLFAPSAPAASTAAVGSVPSPCFARHSANADASANRRHPSRSGIASSRSRLTRAPSHLQAAATSSADSVPNHGIGAASPNPVAPRSSDSRTITPSRRVHAPCAVRTA
ncbi:MAG: hypothetical protein LBI02_01615 [Opitutaceae bacterium]|nr:hypothetical protein [Opitutaceae bacterium]